METHRHLAVRHLARRAAVLPRHSDRVLPGFGECRFINDPDLRLAQQVHHLASQATLHLLHVPGTLSQELAQCLDIPTHARRQRFNRLALSVQQQAFQVDPRPVTPFAASHRRGQILQEMSQTAIQGFQSFRRHAPTVTNLMIDCKIT